MISIMSVHVSSKGWQLKAMTHLETVSTFRTTQHLHVPTCGLYERDNNTVRLLLLLLLLLWMSLVGVSGYGRSCSVGVSLDRPRQVEIDD